MSRIAKALEQLLTVINEDKDGGYFICEEAKPVVVEANLALEGPEQEMSQREWMDYLRKFCEVDTTWTSDNQHPDHSLADWQLEVSRGDTESGYDTWVKHQIEMCVGDAPEPPTLKTYRFMVTRDATESVRVTVEAASIDQAHQMALNDPDKYAEQDGNGIARWELDDGASGDVYIPDPEDYEELGDD